VYRSCALAIGNLTLPARIIPALYGRSPKEIQNKAEGIGAAPTGLELVS